MNGERKNDISERIKFLRGGKLQKEYAEYLGIGKSLISDYETGRTKPTSEVLNIICEKDNVNLNWLLTGKGYPYIRDHTPDEFGHSVVNESISEYLASNKEKDALIEKLKEENERLRSMVVKSTENLLREIGEMATEQSVKLKKKI